MEILKNILFGKQFKRLSHDELNKLAIRDIHLHNATWISVYGGITYSNKDTESYVIIHQNENCCFDMPDYLRKHYPDLV